MIVNMHQHEAFSSLQRLKYALCVRKEAETLYLLLGLKVVYSLIDDLLNIYLYFECKSFRSFRTEYMHMCSIGLKLYPQHDFRDRDLLDTCSLLALILYTLTASLELH